MRKDYTKKLRNVIEINETEIQDHLGELVRGKVKEPSIQCLMPRQMLCAMLRDMSAVKHEKIHGLVITSATYKQSRRGRIESTMKW